jgi:hypothetical protein
MRNETTDNWTLGEIERQVRKHKFYDEGFLANLFPVFNASSISL